MAGRAAGPPQLHRSDPPAGPILLDVIFLAGVLVLAGVTALKNLKYFGDAAPDTVSTDHAICSECRGVFSVRDMIAHNGVNVCASCKPLYLQKLTEGALVKDEMRRAKVAVVPLIIIGTLVVVIILLLLFMYNNWDRPML